MNLNPSDILEKADENDSLSFYRVVYDGFEQAEQRAGRMERFYSVGGYTICLRFAGPGLIPYLAPALEHLKASPSATPDLTVCLWDSTSTGTKMPLLASIFIDLFTERWYECLDRRKEVRAFNSERIPTLKVKQSKKSSYSGSTSKDT